MTDFKTYREQGADAFLLQNKPKCPHCGAEYDPVYEADWEAFDEEKEHFTDCQSCDKEFSFMTQVTHEFTTMGPEND